MAVTRKGSDVYPHVTVFLQSIFVAPFLELCLCCPVSLVEGKRLSRTWVSRSDTLCKSTKTSSLGSAYKPALAGSRSAPGQWQESLKQASGVLWGRCVSGILEVWVCFVSITQSLSRGHMLYIWIASPVLSRLVNMTQKKLIYRQTAKPGHLAACSL